MEQAFIQLRELSLSDQQRARRHLTYPIQLQEGLLIGRANEHLAFPKQNLNNEIIATRPRRAPALSMGSLSKNKTIPKMERS
jgi:hypothetical protein